MSLCLFKWSRIQRRFYLYKIKFRFGIVSNVLFPFGFNRFSLELLWRAFTPFAISVAGFLACHICFWLKLYRLKTEDYVLCGKDGPELSFLFSHFWSCWVTHDKYFAQRISKVSQIFAKVCPVLKKVLIQRFVTDSWNSLVQPSGKISDVVEPRSENWK